MRKNVKNDKVIKAITIGLATMIAATSAPLDVLADTETKTPATPATPATAPVPEVATPVASESETSAPEIVSVESVSEALGEAITQASQFNESSIQDMKDVSSEVKDIKEKTIDGDQFLQNESLKAALTEGNEITEAAVTLDENVKALDENLNSVYLENDDKDKNKPQKDRLQYEVSRDGNDNLIIGEKNCPDLGTSKATVQISGQYGNSYKESYLKNRSVQGTYQAGMEQIQEAINARQNDDKEAEDKALAKAGEFLAACESKFDESTTHLNEARAQYEAAKAASDKADEELGGITEDVISGAIASTEAAQARLDAAKKKADRLGAISEQYYGLMLEYYTKALTKDVAKYNEDGTLDVENSEANAVASKNNDVKSRLASGADLKGSTYEIGRELLEQLVTYKLEGENATDIKFGVNTGDADGINNGDNKPQKKVTIKKDADGKDIIELSSGVSHKQYKEDGSNGRMNHYKVTYTDSQGKPQTKYYNIIYKGSNTDYEGSGVDRTNGIIFVSEVTYKETTDETTGETTGKWIYKPYSSDGSGFLDNYNLTKNYAAVQAAVDEAAAEVEKLTKELKAMQNVASNKKKLTDLATKLEKAEIAYKNSAKSLKDFQDLYHYMLDNVQPNPVPGPDVLPPTGDVTPDGTTDAGAGTGGDTVIDGGDVSVTIPGGYTLPAGMLDAFGGTGTTGGGTTSGVLGVRTGGGNAAEAFGNGAADDQTGAVSKADFGTVNKVLGSKQKKDNSQLAKKIKDNEIPLAEIPNMDDEVTMNWMWLLIIFLLGATGKKMYDEYKKKKEAEEAAKINK